MADYPTPILVLTADPRNQAPELTHRALAVGALALRVKPALESEMANLAREVKLLATIRVIRHVRGVKKTTSSPSNPGLPMIATPAPFSASSLGIICIASSTGGPQVVQKLLAELPADFPVPIAIVQHINAAFSESLVGWLASSARSAMAERITEAQRKQQVAQISRILAARTAPAAAGNRDRAN